MPQAREEFAYLQIERPVLEGAEGFLAKVDHVGRRILGEVIRGSVTEYAMAGDNESNIRPVYNEISVGEPNVKTFDAKDLRLILLHRRVSSHIGARYGFSYHASRFDWPEYPVYPPPSGQHGQLPPQKADLYSQLDQVSRDFGVDPDQLTLMCDKIDIVHDDGPKSVLVLSPQKGTPGEAVIQKQIRVAELRIAQQSAKIAHLSESSTTGAIRIGTVACDVNNEYSRKAFLEELQERLPLRLVIGGVSAARSKNGRKKS